MIPLKTSDLVSLVVRLATAYPQLWQRLKFSMDQIEEYQLGCMRSRLSEARTGVPIYERKSLPEPGEIKTLTDWQQIPILTKDELLSNLKTDRLNREFKIEELIESKSSGSTGKALDVYYDRESYCLFILAGLRLYSMAFKYMPWHSQTYIYTSPYPFNSVFGMYRARFISTLAPVDEQLDHLRRYPPDLLVCYPSHLRSIVDQMTDRDFEIIKPKVVNVNSEMSSPAERRYLAERLRTIVIDDYSSEELTRIASQCLHLSYHIFEDINYMEVVDDSGRAVKEGVVGNLVGTNLHNRAMPLLRYAQGDRGSIARKKCQCGINFRVLENFQGRKNDAFLLPDGALLSSGFLLDLTYELFLEAHAGVREFCLLQDSLNLWTLEVVPGTNWTEQMQTAIPRQFERHLPRDVKIELKVVGTVTRTASGKANPIICRLKK